MGLHIIAETNSICGLLVQKKVHTAVNNKSMSNAIDLLMLLEKLQITGFSLIGSILMTFSVSEIQPINDGDVDSERKF